MMGPQTGAQDRLSYSFNLDTYVPPDHLLRGIDHGLDLSDLLQSSSTVLQLHGTSFDRSRLMIRMLIIGYCFGIRSERRLCEEVQFNRPTDGSAVWELRTKYRITRRSQRTARTISAERCLRYVFERVLQRCIDGAWSEAKGSRSMQA